MPAPCGWTLPAAGWLGKEGRRKPSQAWWVPDGGPGVRREAPLRRAVRWLLLISGAAGTRAGGAVVRRCPKCTWRQSEGPRMQQVLYKLRFRCTEHRGKQQLTRIALLGPPGAGRQLLCPVVGAKSGGSAVLIWDVLCQPVPLWFDFSQFFLAFPALSDVC